MRSTYTHCRIAALTEHEPYKLLIGTVPPRPIALVTPTSRKGRANAGPFSIFNVITHDPAIFEADAIRLTNAERSALEELAADAGLPFSTYIVTVLRAHIANKERP